MTTALKRAERSKLPTSAGEKAFDILNILILTLVMLVVLYPLWFIIIASLSDPAAVLRGEVLLLPKGFNFEAYRRVMQHQDILRSYANSLFYTITGTVLGIVLSVCAAYPLARKDMRGRKFITAFFLFTMFFSGGIIPKYLVVSNLGMLDTILAVILPNVITMYNVIIVRTYFENSIPWEIQEAAIIDGCSDFRLLTQIVLPLSKPVLAVVALFYGVANWNAYFEAMMYLTTRAKFPLQLIVRELLILNSMGESLSSTTSSSQVLMGQGIKYAVVVVASIPILIVYPFVQRHFIKGVMIGAVKG